MVVNHDRNPLQEHCWLDYSLLYLAELFLVVDNLDWWMQLKP